MNRCDLFASVSHLMFAVFLAFAGAVLLRLTRGHGRVRRWAVGLYALSAVLLYVASGVFHGVRYWELGPPEVFRRFDLCGIFLLVAGSYLPAFAYLLPTRARNAMTAVLGGLAVVGVVAVWVMESPKSGMMVPLYTGMALVGLIPLPVYVRVAGWRGVGLMFAAAGVYATGGACELLQWPTPIPDLIGPHEVLHLTDIGGTLVHFTLVMRLMRKTAV
jgi:hemolysin III